MKNVKAIAWVVGVVLFGSALGMISARRNRIRNGDPQENAAFLYYHAMEDVLHMPAQTRQPRIGFDTNDVEELNRRMDQAQAILEEAVKKDVFDPTNVRVNGKPIAVGRVLDDMASAALILYRVASATAKDGQWQKSLEASTGLARMSEQAGSYRSGAAISSDIETMATRTWWMMVRRQANNPEAMRRAKGWLTDFRSYVADSAPKAGLETLVDGVKSKTARGLAPRKTLDPATKYAQRHVALQAAQVAFEILENKKYLNPATIREGFSSTLVTNPFSGQPLSISAFDRGFVIECYKPGMADSLRMPVNAIVFRFGETDTNPGSNLYDYY